jgi:hypothetical protein
MSRQTVEPIAYQQCDFPPEETAIAAEVAMFFAKASEGSRG